MTAAPRALLAVAVLGAAVLPSVAPAGAQAPAARLAGPADLWAVQGDVALGRPTAYVTFRTAEGAGPRDLVVRVSGSSGRTYAARDGRRGDRPGDRRAWRAAFRPYQRTPEPARLKPGVTYEVTFFARASLNGPRERFATRRLRARALRAGDRIPRPR